MMAFAGKTIFANTLVEEQFCQRAAGEVAGGIASTWAGVAEPTDVSDTIRLGPMAPIPVPEKSTDTVTGAKSEAGGPQISIDLSLTAEAIWVAAVAVVATHSKSPRSTHFKVWVAADAALKRKRWDKPILV